MTLFLTILLVLWGLPQAGAVELTGEAIRADQRTEPDVSMENSPCLFRGPRGPVNDKMFFDCFLPYAKGSLLVGVKLTPDSCRAQLEVVMRAMDRFVQGLIISTDRAVTVWQSGAQQQFNAAKKQWDAAKACWQEPTP